MSVFVWWMIPLVALIIGIAWAYRASRPPKPAAMSESMESFSRFCQALDDQQPSLVGQSRSDAETSMSAERTGARHQA